MKELNVALLGFGNVGRAFTRYVERTRDDRELKLRVRAVSDASGGVMLDSQEQISALLRHKESGRNVADFAPNDAITNMRDFVAALPAAGVAALVESLPTNLRDGQPALDLLTAALARGIHVVTVDKGPLVHGFAALKGAATRGGARFGFSGTTGVSIPAGLAGERVLEIRGVLNGTTNYILTAMQERAISFAQALADAQAAGIAEPDPALDIEGWDTAAKILILANALMDADGRINEVSRIGIGVETDALIQVARERGDMVRLVGRARIWQGRVRLSVAPKVVKPDSLFYAVKGTSKAAIFRTADRGEIQAFARSGRDAISQTIIDDLLQVAGE
ncbi:MAG TPA: hypothetical protein VNO70_09980 [Blastocatellia bacterium]|nr:hypothetical protein [Blastocatellia bacterium]